MRGPVEVGLLVIGGGAAGMSAASWARRKDPGLSILVLEATRLVSHAPCGIPYFVGGLFDDPKLLQAYDAGFFRERRRIEVMTETRVVEVDVGGRWAVAEGPEGALKVEFDRLVVATGARPRRLREVEGDRVLYAHHPADACALRSRLSAASSVTVVGGGVLGVELAEQLARLGKRVTLVHRGPYLMSRDFDRDLGEMVTRQLESLGVRVLLGASAASSREGGSVVRLDDGREVSSDVTVVAAGVEPNADLVAGQLPLGPHGAVLVDDRMEAGRGGVFAAGDVAEHRNVVTGEPDWRPLAPIANKMGLVAGVNAAGGDLRFPGVVGDLVTRVGGVLYGRVGLTEAEAARRGLRYVVGAATIKSRARYYPGGGDVYVKLVAEEATGRIVGGEVAGPEEVVGRLGIIAAAVMKRMTAEDLFFVEIGYHPSAGRAWDPVVLAARQLLRV